MNDILEEWYEGEMRGAVFMDAVFKQLGSWDGQTSLTSHLMEGLDIEEGEAERLVAVFFPLAYDPSIKDIGVQLNAIQKCEEQIREDKLKAIEKARQLWNNHLEINVKEVEW